MNTTIKYTSVDANLKESTKSITYANPEASDYVLKTTAQMLNNLSTHTLTNVTRVDTKDITNATNE